MNQWIAALAAGALLAGPAMAETTSVATDTPDQAIGDTAAPKPDFTFKRVKPPIKGAKKLITVQIAPKANPAVPLPLPARPGPVKRVPDAQVPAQDVPGRYAWYWELIPPDMATSGPGRLAEAVAALSQGPDRTVPRPRLSRLQPIAEAHGREILTATVGTRVSPALVLALIHVESAGKVQAVSRAGATGLMQLMPVTATRFGVEDASDAAQNIKGGVAFLDHLMDKFGGDPVLVLAAYNAGEGAVSKFAGVPPYAETRDYVPKVLAAWSVARGMCLTPPELISDGCVFRLGTRS